MLDDRIWLLIWIGVPLLVANILLSRSGSVFREDRYLLFMGPFVLWAIARGVVTLGERWRAVGWTLGIVVTLLIAGSLPRLWTPDAYRENWRAATDYMVDYQQASPALPGAIVAHIDYTRRPIQWYLQKEDDIEETLPVFFPFGSTIAPDEADDVVGPPIDGIRETGAATLWLTQSHLDGVDDERVVQNWLNSQYPLVTEQFPTGINLTGYALQSRFDELPELSPDAFLTEAELVPGLTLAACELLTPDDQRRRPGHASAQRLGARAPLVARRCAAGRRLHRHRADGRRRGRLGRPALPRQRSPAPLAHQHLAAGRNHARRGRHQSQPGHAGRGVSGVDWRDGWELGSRLVHGWSVGGWWVR